MLTSRKSPGRRTVYICSIGCNRRNLDSSRLARYFVTNGCRLTDDPNQADIVIVTTCAVNKCMEEQSIRKLEEFAEHHDRVIVYGCLPKVNPAWRQRVPPMRFLDTMHIERIDEFFPEFSVTLSQIGDANLPYENVGSNRLRQTRAKAITVGRALAFRMSRYIPRQADRWLSRRNARRFTIRIAWGCNGNCSYCGTRKAIGAFRSKPPRCCMEELRAGLKSGYQRFDLIADDIGAYGIDIGTTFPALFGALMEQDAENRITRINFHNLNPQWLIKYQSELERIAAGGRIDKIMIPIQSGSRRILRRMKRDDRVAEMENAVSSLKARGTDIRFHTDIIIGFPGEGKEDVALTLEMLARTAFEHVNIFRFDGKRGTPAAVMPEQVKDDVVEERIRTMIPELRRLGMSYEVL